MPVVPELQEIGRKVWSAGHWDQVADYVSRVGPALLDAVGIEPGMRVLDVGTGSGGSVAIPAAVRGAEVVGSDITSAHFDDARRRASDAGVEIEWVEADALELPFDDNSFDRVLSTFGHMFAPDHQLAADEMVRVCKPGGVIGFACWTPEGLTGQMFRVTSSRMPPPPDGVLPPPMWGVEDHVRQLLSPHGIELEFERRMNVFSDDGGMEQYMDTFTTNFGPMVMARQALADQWDDVVGELRELFIANNQGNDGKVHLEGEYLQTIARKPA